MPSPAKPPAPQGVSAALRRAGFDRAGPLPSRIRGLSERSAGYTVRKALSPAGCVEVLWRPSTLHHGPSREQCQRMLMRYLDALLEAGYRARMATTCDHLTVYAKRG